MATKRNVHDKTLVGMRLICVIIIFNGMTRHVSAFAWYKCTACVLWTSHTFWTRLQDVISESSLIIPTYQWINHGIIFTKLQNNLQIVQEVI